MWVVLITVETMKTNIIIFFAPLHFFFSSFYVVHWSRRTLITLYLHHEKEIVDSIRPFKLVVLLFCWICNIFFSFFFLYVDFHIFWTFFFIFVYPCDVVVAVFLQRIHAYSISLLLLFFKSEEKKCLRSLDWIWSVFM